MDLIIVVLEIRKIYGETFKSVACLGSRKGNTGGCDETWSKHFTSPLPQKLCVVFGFLFSCMSPPTPHFLSLFLYLCVKVKFYKDKS